MSAPPAKRKVMGRVDLAQDPSHRNHTPSPTARNVRAQPINGSSNTSSTPPIRRATTQTSAGTPVARARVDMSAVVSPSGTPPIRRAVTANTPTGSLSAATSSPFARHAVTSPSVAGSPHPVASAPVTPRVRSSTEASVLLSALAKRSPSPSRPITATPIERVGSSTVSSIRRSQSVRRVAAQSVDWSSSRSGSPAGGMSSSATTSNLSAAGKQSSSPAVSGRMSPSKTSGHLRAQTSYQVPTLAQLNSGSSSLSARVTLPPNGSPATRSQPPTRSRTPSPVSSMAVDRVPRSAIGSHITLASPFTQCNRVTATGSPSAAAFEQSVRPQASPIQTSNVHHHVQQPSSLSVQHRSSDSSLGASSATEPRKPVTTTSAAAAAYRATLTGGVASPPSGFSSSSRHRPPIPSFSSFSAAEPPSSSTALPTPPPSAPAASQPQPQPSLVSPPLLSPSSETVAPLEYAQLRTERKIADLEITNKSLLAINQGMEVSKHRQAKEIRELKRRLKEGRFLATSTSADLDALPLSPTSGLPLMSPFSTGSSATDWSEDDYFVEEEKEDPELEASHLRCQDMITKMLTQARESILSKYVLEERKSRVLGIGEAVDLQQQEEEEAEADREGNEEAVVGDAEDEDEDEDGIGDETIGRDLSLDLDRLSFADEPPLPPPGQIVRLREDDAEQGSATPTLHGLGLLPEV